MDGPKERRSYPSKENSKSLGKKRLAKLSRPGFSDSSVSTTGSEDLHIGDIIILTDEVLSPRELEKERPNTDRRGKSVRSGSVTSKKTVITERKVEKETQDTDLEQKIGSERPLSKWLGLNLSNIQYDMDSPKESDEEDLCSEDEVEKKREEEGYGEEEEKGKKKKKKKKKSTLR
eukprot:TRINITY_DN5650_c0_g1_i2.p1 TRINITY_DN5650_c0_g1~~TRINITY_DN5650_c0_g1_i2.p1  ORF type:complete len:175 (-),score=47.77 TRINITY_DN5650_c0_g1_i2:11-535(-)